MNLASEKKEHYEGSQKLFKYSRYNSISAKPANQLISSSSNYQYSQVSSKAPGSLSRLNNNTKKVEDSFLKPLQLKQTTDSKDYNIRKSMQVKEEKELSSPKNYLNKSRQSVSQAQDDLCPEKNSRVSSQLVDELSSYNKGSKPSKKITKVESFVSSKSRPLSSNLNSQFKNIRTFLSPKIESSGLSRVLSNKNDSQSYKYTSSKLIQQKISLSKFKKIGDSTPADRLSRVSEIYKVNLERKRNTEFDENKVNDSSKVEEEWKNLVSQDADREYSLTKNQDSNDSQRLKKSSNEFKPLDNILQIRESPSKKIFEDDQNRFLNFEKKNNEVVQLSPNKQTTVDKSEVHVKTKYSLGDEGDKGVYYNLYVKQRDENSKLKTIIKQLEDQLTESNHRAQVTSYFFSIQSIKFLTFVIDIQRFITGKISIGIYTKRSYKKWKI